MKRHDQHITIEDGSRLYLFECLHCGAKAHAGIDANRFVVVKPALESAAEIRKAGGIEEAKPEPGVRP
jgi:hypothetical protein